MIIWGCLHIPSKNEDGCRDIFSVVPKATVNKVAVMLKAIHTQEDQEAALEKIDSIVQKLKNMKLKNAAKSIKEGALETLNYYVFPTEHMRSLRTNNPFERIM